MKRTIGIGFCAVLWTSTVALAAPRPTSEQEKDWFPDVPATHWARSPLIMVARAGIVKGDSKGHFHGNAPVTRHEFALTLDRWSARRSSPTLTFPTPIPQWAKEQKTYLTRYEFAVALSRLSNFLSPQTSSELPAQTATSQPREPTQELPQDVLDVIPAHWAYSGVRYAASIGILEGDFTGRFHGDALLTRYELVVALMRFPTRHYITAG